MAESSALATTSDQPKPLATAQGTDPEPTDAELERGILDAVMLELGDVARTLAGRLEERRMARAGNVVALDAKRRRGAP